MAFPNFKLEKHVIDRRIEQMRAEGVTFMTNAHVGVNVPVEALTEHYDAILLCGRRRASAQPRIFLAASSRAFTMRWSFCPSRIAAAKATWSISSYDPAGHHGRGQAGGDHRRRRHGRRLSRHDTSPGRD
jgi:hypothetical protein